MFNRRIHYTAEGSYVLALLGKRSSSVVVLSVERKLMDRTTIAIALISACSALFGASIGLIGQVINNYHIRQLEVENVKREKYSDLIKQMQLVFNNPSEATFSQFQSAVNIVDLFASDQVASLLNKYYKNVIVGHNPSQGDVDADHKKYQSDIINAMRKDLGIGRNTIDDLGLLASKWVDTTEVRRAK